MSECTDGVDVPSDTSKAIEICISAGNGLVHKLVLLEVLVVFEDVVTVCASKNGI